MAPIPEVLFRSNKRFNYPIYRSSSHSWNFPILWSVYTFLLISANLMFAWLLPHFSRQKRGKKKELKDPFVNPFETELFVETSFFPFSFLVFQQCWRQDSFFFASWKFSLYSEFLFLLYFLFSRFSIIFSVCSPPVGYAPLPLIYRCREKFIN